MGESGGWKKGLMLLVIVAGFIEAFSAGMNNVANAVGPLVGANLIGTGQGKSLYNTIQEEKRAINEDGGGI